MPWVRRCVTPQKDFQATQGWRSCALAVSRTGLLTGRPTRTVTRPLVNWEWDRKFMDCFCKGDTEWLKNLTYEEVEEEAGHGGHEVLNWVALSGAMRGSPAKMLLYEPVIEWICGMT